MYDRKKTKGDIFIMRIIHVNDDKLLSLGVDIPGVYFTIPSIGNFFEARKVASFLYYRVGFLNEAHQGDLDTPSCYTGYKPLFTLLNPRLPEPGYIYHVSIANYFKICFIEVINRNTGEVYHIIPEIGALTPYDSLNRVQHLSVTITNPEQHCDVRDAFYKTMDSSIKKFTEINTAEEFKTQKRLCLPLKTAKNFLFLNESHWITVDQKILPPQLSDPPCAMKCIINKGISCFVSSIQNVLDEAKLVCLDLTYGDQCIKLPSHYFEGQEEKTIRQVLTCSLVNALIKHNMSGGWNRSNFLRIMRDPCLRFLYDLFFRGDNNTHNTLCNIVGFDSSNHNTTNTYLYVRSGSVNNPIKDGGLYLPYIDVFSHGPYIQLKEYHVETKQGQCKMCLQMDGFLHMYKRGYFGGREFHYQKTATESDLLDFSIDNACLHLFLSQNKLIIIHDTMPSYGLIVEKWFNEVEFKEWIGEFHSLFKVDLNE